MPIELIVRVVGLIVLAGVGWSAGETLRDEIAFQGIPHIEYVQYALVVIGALLGFTLAPWLSIRPLSWAQKEIRRIPIQTLVAATVGLAVGLLISVPIAYATSKLQVFNLDKILPIVGALVLGYLGIMAGITRQKDLFAFMGGRWGRGGSGQKSEYVLLDTSVIIDGRIEYVSQTGFIEGTLLVPRFVLDEIQHIADSPDTLRRNRGRRGLEVLNKLQKSTKVPIEITDMDADDADDVDGKLVQLARKLRCPIVTNDYNLNRVAGLQGVKVLNINELANAVKTLILPGETIKVRIIQEGKELGQGVGYLDDGTMVVVDNGRRFINTTLEVMVTRVLQTDKGRMMFATPDGGLIRSS
jgi:uncharacterized protein YacL